MKTFTAAAHQRHGFVQPDDRLAEQGSGVSAEPHKWRDLLDPVIQAKDALGLNPTDLSVLRTILSFIPNDTLSLTRPDGHICFARNTTIAERLGRSGDSTVNRAVRRLEEAGLITRRYSSNRKRYARRSGAGDITHAYGIDVAPLIEGRAEINKLANRARETQERLSCLREDCKDAVAMLQQQIHALADQVAERCQAALEAARCALRRKPAIAALSSLKAELEALLALSPIGAVRHNPTKETPKRSEVITSAGKVSNSNKQTEQHKETETHNPSVSKAKRQITFEDLEASFPKMMALVRTSRDFDDFHNRVDILAQSFGDTARAWKETKHTLGFQVALLLLGYLVQNQERISNHGGYLRSMASKINAGEVAVSSLLGQDSKYGSSRGLHR